MNAVAGNNGGICTETIAISATGLNAGNCISITQIGNPDLSHFFNRQLNTLNDLTEGEYYKIKMKTSADVVGISTKLGGTDVIEVLGDNDGTAIGDTDGTVIQF